LLELYNNGDLVKGCKVVIWNNGPNSISFELPYNNGDVEWFFEESINNMSLAKIYNQFISSYSAERYVILDYDTKPNSNYIYDVLSLSIDKIGIPIIKNKGVVQSPRVNRGFSLPPYRKTDSISAIGSGLNFSNKTVEMFINEYGNVFDDRFVLYGIDSTFFIRLARIGLNDELVLCSEIQHSLSRLENEGSGVTEFRRIERGYDFGLQLRFYFRFKLLVSFFKILIFSLGRNNSISVWHIFSSFIRGYHPRSKN
jgi:hypothetical protein